jgi:hypothetical protein
MHHGAGLKLDPQAAATPSCLLPQPRTGSSRLHPRARGCYRRTPPLKSSNFISIRTTSLGPSRTVSLGLPSSGDGPSLRSRNSKWARWGWIAAELHPTSSRKSLGCHHGSHISQTCRKPFDVAVWAEEQRPLLEGRLTTRMSPSSLTRRGIAELLGHSSVRLTLDRIRTPVPLPRRAPPRRPGKRVRTKANPNVPPSAAPKGFCYLASCSNLALDLQIWLPGLRVATGRF